MEVQFMTMEALEAGLADIRQSPKDNGNLEMIVRRPAIDAREVLENGKLDVNDGLVGDNWRTRGCPLTEDGSAHPEMQLNIMNTRVISLVAQDKERWQLAGDQMFVDLDLSADNLSPGTRLAIGSAVVEVTEMPHKGCKKFVERFGKDAMQFVNSPIGRELNLRGINAKVVTPGLIQVGDRITKLK